MRQIWRKDHLAVMKVALYALEQLSQSSKPSCSVRSSHLSKLSVKRQEAAVELAAMEATLKVMEEMKCERKKLQELELEQKRKACKTSGRKF